MATDFRPEDALMAAISARAATAACGSAPRLHPFATGTLLSLAVDAACDDTLRRDMAIDRIREMTAAGMPILSQKWAA